MEQKIRILQVLTIMGRGGAETMVMNYYRALDKSKYQFDFLVHRQERGVYDDEIERLGGRIFRTCPVRPGYYLKYFISLDCLFKEHAKEFVAVHTHIQENSGFALKYAAKYGIVNRLCTSHCASIKYDIKYVFRKYASLYLNKYVTKRLSCGVEAGKAIYRREPFTVIPNAINVTNFIYSSSVNEEIRRELAIDSSVTILGHVGRLGVEKNHAFMLQVLREYLKLDKQAILLCIGEGNLRKEIEYKVKQMKLENNVRLLGGRSDVSRVIQCFNIFLFPSLFEGLPVSVIEAQAAGLRCFLSDTIDHTTDVTGDITFISLNKSPKEWARIIYSSLPYQRPNNLHKIQYAGYDVSENMEKLLNLYLY